MSELDFLRGSALSRRALLRGTGLAFVGLSAAALVGCGDDDDEAPAQLGTASVLGVWGSGDELDRFEAMVAPWQSATGGRMGFTGTRDLTALLTTRVEGNDPPDIAIPPEVGLFRQFAREGRLVPLADCGLDEFVKENYPQAFIDLGTVDGTLYGFFMKADNKGTIWYNPKVFAENGWEPLTADSTFDDLLELTQTIAGSGLAPWSIGVESGGASGWPGTDWLQQILLGEPDGPEVNDGLVDGSIPWTDPRVQAVWEQFGQIALNPDYTVQGGPTGINATAFVPSSYPPYEDTPTAAMVYLGGFAAGFIAEQFPSLVAGEDYDFMPFPGGGIAGGANVVFAFNDEATTCSLMQHLASAEAQQIWVDQGGFTSVNNQVNLDGYPDIVSRKLAEGLLSAKAFRFDLDDAIGGATQQAIFAGVTEYLANPGSLGTILQNIEGARQAEG